MKKIYNLLMFVLVGSLCLGSVLGINIDDSDIMAYYPLYDNSTDYSNNWIDGTDSGVTFNGETGVFSSGDYIDIGDLESSDNTYSWGMKMNSATISSTIYPLSKYDGTNNYPYLIQVSGTTNKIMCAIRYSGTSYSVSSTTSYSPNSYQTIVCVRDGGNLKIYIDGTLENTDTITSSVVSSPTDTRIGEDTFGASSSFVGEIKEVLFMDRVLNSSDINDYHNNGINIISTPTIQANIQDFYSSQNISIDLTNSSNTNMSYDLDNSNTTTSICNNCSNATLDLFNLSEGSHSILFVSTNQDGQVNSSYNFTIDLTPPEINNTLPSNLSSYELGNISNYITCLDIGSGGSCTINFTPDNVTLNTSEIYNFTYNGNQSYTIAATDSAGNSATESGTILVDPEQCFYFEDYLGNPLSNFTFGGSSYTTAACIPLFDLGYGNHTLNFSKLGYQVTPVSFSLNSTSEINLTTAVGISKVYVSIYDRDNLSLINQLVEVDLIGDPDNTDQFAGSYSTSNGSLTIDNISEIPGTYKLEFQSSGYANNEYYFTHTGFEAKNISIYMINFNSTFPIKFIVENIDGDPEKFCLFKVKQYFIGSNDYLIVDMGRTNSLGQVIFDLEYDVNYQYVIECDGQTQTEPGQKITETPTTIIFNPDQTSSAFENLPNVVGDVTFGNYSNSSGYFRFEYNDMKNIVSKGCLEIYRKGATSNTLLYSKCQSLPSATLNQDINWTIGDRFVAKGYVWADGQEYLGDQLNKDFLPGADEAWALGFGFWGSILIVLTLFIVGSIHHPITGALLSILGLLVSIGFKALDVETSLVMGIGIIVVGAILLRRRR